jgi:flagellar motility protein MotE (MotC chaperone)
MVREAPGVRLVGPSWEFSNPEADQLVTELKEEKSAVATRQQELNEMATRLDAERSELGQVTQSVRQLQNDFDKSVLHVQTDETANLKKLAKVYSEMDPQTAADVFVEMDDVSIVKIMIFMKDSETAGILEALAKKGKPQAHRTAMISDRLRLASTRPLPTK